MNDSLSICLSCGLCCDGSVIGFVQLSSEELPALKEIMEFEDENGKGFFLQPCKNYCDGCTIYSKRPKQCESYKCGVLKSVEQKELDFEEAVKIISLVKQRKIAIENKLEILQLDLQPQSFYYKMIELKKLLQKNKSESPLTQNYLELESELNQLNSALLKEFALS